MYDKNSLKSKGFGEFNVLDIIECISVDSCKVRIPLTSVEIYDKSLVSSKSKVTGVLVDKKTGEVISDDVPLGDIQNFYEEDGIKTRFCIESIKAGVNEDKSPVYVDYLTFGINSKMLKERYFEGILSYNLYLVYDYVMSIGKFKFSFEDFKDAYVTDVDLKCDFIVEFNLYKGLVDLLYRMTRDCKDKGRGAEIFNRKDNYGIEWGNRRSSKVNLHRHLKLYHKGLQMKYEGKKGMFEFYSKYLSGYEGLDDLVRYEVNMKNAADIRRFGYDFSRLWSVVSELSKSVVPGSGKECKGKIHSRVFKKALETHLKGLKTKELRDGSLSGMDLLVFNLMDFVYYNLNVNRDELFSAVVSDHKGRNAFRIAKKFHNFFDVIEGSRRRREDLPHAIDYRADVLNRSILKFFQFEFEE